MKCWHLSHMHKFICIIYDQRGGFMFVSSQLVKKNSRIVLVQWNVSCYMSCYLQKIPHDIFLDKGILLLI